VDLDAFFVSVERLHNPSLKDKPVIVGGIPGSRGVVSAASYEARRYGVHSAMPLVQAQRLCPQAVFLPVHFSRYIDASRHFMTLLESMSSHIEPRGLDEAFLDVTNVVEDSEQALTYATTLRCRVREELGLTTSIGVATCKIVAKVASDHNKPDGLVLVPPGDEAGFLAPLDVRKLPGVGKKTADCLEDMGIRRIGQLAAIPHKVLYQKLGRYGLLLLAHARGIDNSRVEPRGEPKTISRETTFQTDTRDPAFLQSALCAMCEEVVHDMRAQRKRTGTVTLKIRFEDFQTITRQCSLKEHTSEASELLAATRDLLKAVIENETRRIRLIGVKTSRLSGPERQLDMFSQEALRLRRLEHAIAQVHREYGPDSIRTLGEHKRNRDSFRRTTASTHVRMLSKRSRSLI